MIGHERRIRLLRRLLLANLTTLIIGSLSEYLTRPHTTDLALTTAGLWDAIGRNALTASLVITYGAWQYACGSRDEARRRPTQEGAQ